MEVKILVLQFLYAIAGVESNHGQLTNHPVIENPKSIHYGHQAIGAWGMMPNTLMEMARNPTTLDTIIFDKRRQKKIAKKYALKVLQAARGCVLDANILWLKGPNYKITPLEYQTNRMKRFIKEWETVSKTPIFKDKIILRYCFNIKR